MAAIAAINLGRAGSRWAHCRPSRLWCQGTLGFAVLSANLRAGDVGWVETALSSKPNIQSEVWVRWASLCSAPTYIFTSGHPMLRPIELVHQFTQAAVVAAVEVEGETRQVGEFRLVGLAFTRR